MKKKEKTRHEAPLPGAKTLGTNKIPKLIEETNHSLPMHLEKKREARKVQSEVEKKEEMDIFWSQSQREARDHVTPAVQEDGIEKESREVKKREKISKNAPFLESKILEDALSSPKVPLLTKETTNYKMMHLENEIEAKKIAFKMEKEKHLRIIQEAFLRESEYQLSQGYSVERLREATGTPSFEKKETLYSKKLFFLLSIVVAIGFSLDDAMSLFYESRCLLPNNYLVWEFTRPVSNCDYCRGVDSALVLPNQTREEFEKLAYSSRPIIVKNAATLWSASRVFGLDYFRDLYENTEGAYDSVDEECQFLHFKSNFARLRDVFGMNEERARNLEGEAAWYVGWKNCHPQILEKMNQFYQPPHFLPREAEIPKTNYIFLGYEQGAVMHLDYIPRLMWQGQILGRKRWSVAPSPECENVCKRFEFTVATGDVLLIDTRLWYHGTYVEGGTFSLTVTSEYG